MKQISNILIKDFRHHWREIAASLVLQGAYSWVEIHQWMRPDTTYGWSGLTAFQFLSRMTVPSLLVSWTFLIVRVVQGDALVGERQFWVTRPYDWKKLLAAKALFLLSFVNFPLFVLQASLLARAGFHPSSHLYGLFWMQLMWLIFFLSAVAIASVTATVGQVLLAALFIALYMVCMAFLSQVLPDANVPAGNDWWSPLLFLISAVAVILIQYRRRRTALARWVIVAFACCVALSMVATPYRKLMAHAYPLGSEAESPIRLTLTPGHHHDQNADTRDDDEIEIRLPYRLSDLRDGSILHIDGTILTLTNSAGVHWDSGWKSRYELIFPDTRQVQIDFQVKKRIFDEIKSGSVNAKLLLAFTLYHDQNQRRFVPPNGEFENFDLGLCSFESNGLRQLHCRLPLRKPPFLLISSEIAASTCPLGANRALALPGQMAHDSVRGDPDPAEFGVSPVQTEEVYLSDDDTSLDVSNRGICPGTPLTLSNPVAVKRGRIELQVENLPLSDYQPDQSQSIFVLPD